jgi:hypothetical protein
MPLLSSRFRQSAVRQAHQPEEEIIVYLRLLPLALLALLLMALLGVDPAFPQDKLSPSNLSKLNTKADEDDPVPTPDGFGLLYTSNTEGTFDLMLS